MKLIPDTSQRKTWCRFTERKAVENWMGMNGQTYTTNMHMITWVLVRAEKKIFKAELVEGKYPNVDC